ncbi:MAG: hypothetical protein JW894_09985 [Bacteroidales bacterium]|nr:hypothetical protein [Bacteroidales bacterium]
MRYFLLIIATLYLNQILAQQDQQLFHMHYLGESNFMNPAVQSQCKWFIGIPILSSIHLNYANSGFTYNQAIEPQSDSSYHINIDQVTSRLGRRTIISGEFHTTLLAIGHLRDEYYYTFSVIEKVNVPFTFSKEFVSLVWEGNRPFEGEEANLKGTAPYATYYREYAFGVSKYTGHGNYYGVKAKLLFGKLNLSAPKLKVSVYTDPVSFQLRMHAEGRINMSAPVEIDYVDGNINDIRSSYGTTNLRVGHVTDILFNRKNWGIAFDLGFIRPYNSKITLSGSVLDIGFIRWRSNLNNIIIEEQDFEYNGILADSIGTEYFTEVILDSIQFDVTQKPFFTFLPTKFYFGAEYEINPKLSGRGLLSGILYRTKFVAAATFSLDYNPFGYFHVVGSYSMMYRSFNNFGLAVAAGRWPVQFYIISDNITGFIWPLSARNINLRFGLNINIGCKTKIELPEGMSSTTFKCPVYDDDVKRKKRKSGWRKRK